MGVLPPLPPVPLPPLLPLPPPLQLTSKLPMNTISTAMPIHPRRRRGRKQNKTHPRVAPALVYQGNPGCLRAALAAAVVITLSVTVCAGAPLIVTEAGETLYVAGSLAAAGLTAQVNATAPLNPPEPVTLTVAVLPVAAPGATVIPPLFVSAKPGGTALTVITTALEVLPAKLLRPETRPPRFACHLIRQRCSGISYWKDGDVHQVPPTR